MQVLEGEEEVVTTFAGTIAGDSRHKGVFVPVTRCMSHVTALVCKKVERMWNVTYFKSQRLISG